MRVWIDILTPKQALFFKPLIEELKRKYEVLSTSRSYREVNQLAKRIGLEILTIGKHGGGSLYDKLVASSERIQQLADFINKWKPDCAISFSSPECARVTYGLNLKHICINDSPHAQSVAKLTIPLSEILLTPWIIPYSAWTCFGIPRNRIVKYKALDPAIWLRRKRPYEKDDSDFKIDRTRKTIVIRLEESFASYLYRSNKTWSDRVLKSILHEFPDNNIIVLCRYEPQISKILEIYRDKFIVPKKAIIGSNLLKTTDVFIGMGGTMTAEAALMGVPAISAYQGGDTYVENYLIRKRLLVKPHKISGILQNMKILLEDESKRTLLKIRAERILSCMEDPVPKILSVIDVKI